MAQTAVSDAIVERDRARALEAWRRGIRVRIDLERRAFVVPSFDAGSDEEYLCSIVGPDRCQCWPFIRNGHCKHLSLIAIQADEVVSRAEYQEMPR